MKEELSGEVMYFLWVVCLGNRTLLQVYRDETNARRHALLDHPGKTPQPGCDPDEIYFSGDGFRYYITKQKTNCHFPTDFGGLLASAEL